MQFFRILSVCAVASSILAFQPAAPADAAAKYCDGPKVTWRYSVFGKRRAITEGPVYVSRAKEILDGLKAGAFEAGMVRSSYHSGNVRAMGVLDLAFLPFPNFEVMRTVYDMM